MPAAIAIPAIIGAGASIGSGIIGAHAAGSAADQETQAANQARAYSQQATQQALGRLDAGQQGIRYAPTYTAPGAQSSGAYGALAGAMGLSSRPSTPAMQTPYQPPGQPSGPMVTLMDDNGVHRQVPREQAQRFITQGARVVS